MHVCVSIMCKYKRKSELKDGILLRIGHVTKKGIHLSVCAQPRETQKSHTGQTYRSTQICCHPRRGAITLGTRSDLGEWV